MTESNLFVRVYPELVAQLKAAPSRPVTVQIEEREGGELFMIFTEHLCSLPDSISEALNSGDGVYRP